MNRELLLRRALSAAAVFNVGGAVLFGFPASGLGPVLGLPAEVPLTYRVFVALFVLLFAGAYAWLAAQPAMNRPFVLFGAIGKLAAFAAMLVLCLLGEVPVLSVVVGSGDLLFAGLFVWCLSTTKPR